MALVKNEIPILEYDDSQTAVIMPNRKNLYGFPRKAVFPFLSDEIEKYAANNCCEKIGEFISATKLYPIYKTTYKGKEICLCQAPVGAAAAVQIMDYLIGYGVKEIISAGCCGALIDIGENEFLIPTEALRCEGTSYHYLPPSRTVKINAVVLNCIKQALTENDIKFTECKTWSTDGFYRETKEIVEYRKQEGFQVVEMECSALAACAEFRKVTFGQILFTADTLADVEKYDERDWGTASFPIALKACFDAVSKI
jgi:uridine phosphorylase